MYHPASSECSTLRLFGLCFVQAFYYSTLYAWVTVFIFLRRINERAKCVGLH